MKRPIKPFVVEVRKGAKTLKKKTPVTDLLPVELFEEKPRENGALKRAEAVLFKPAPKVEEAGLSNRSGRILESIPVGEEPVEEPLVEARRRGRPPGARNKPKDIEPASSQPDEAPKRRGRPPKVVEGSVRKVELTPELASAALESIAKAAEARPLIPILPAQKGRVASSAAKPQREPRPAKPDKLLARQAKLEAKQAKLLAKQEKLEAKQQAKLARQAKPKPPSAAAIRKAAASQGMPDRASAPKSPASKSLAPKPSAPISPAPGSRPSNPLDALPRLIRIGLQAAQGDPSAMAAALQRPPAGQRWRRRLRGAAFFAYERRQRKTNAAPR
jgi:hypothetical protein